MGEWKYSSTILGGRGGSETVWAVVEKRAIFSLTGNRAPAIQPVDVTTEIPATKMYELK
jgi:hypothetical protein